MLRLILTIVLGATALPGADFTFNVLIRAGAVGNSDWEVGMGSNGATTVTGQLSPFWNLLVPQRFEIGYNGATGQAFTRIYADSTTSNLRLNVNYAVPNAHQNPNGYWNFPAGSFFVDAPGFPLLASGAVTNLVLTSASGSQSLSDFSGPGAQPNIVFYSQSNGNWMLSGQLNLFALRALIGGAVGSELQLGLTANAVPEPGSFVLAAMALGILAWRRRELRLAVVRQPFRRS